MSVLEGKDNVSKTEYCKVLKELYNYTVYHFKYEENEMEKKKYPQASVHKQMHKVFLDKIVTWEKESKLLPDTIRGNDANKVFQFGIAWLNRHILTTDKKFVEFLNSTK